MGTYQGTYPKLTVTISRSQVIKDMNSWTTMIANDNSFHYKLWRGNDAKTKICPICNNIPKDKSTKDPKEAIMGYHGWNCIGGAFAVWHHGGNLNSSCSCHVIADDTAVKIYKAKTDAEALKIVKKYTGLDDVTVIRNGSNNIPKSKWKAGDIMLQFVGEKYTHMFYYRGSGKIFDATGSKGKTAVDKQVGVRDYKNYTSRVIIRWTGNGITRNYLQTGDSGAEVTKLQKFLNWALDLKLVEDGKFGELTEKAVKSFQKKVKLTQDGKWGADSNKAAKTFNKTEKVSKIETPKEEKKEEVSKTETSTVKKVSYTGTLPTSTLIKSNEQVKKDSVTWAKWVAGDNRFHYGYTNKHGSTDYRKWNPNAHHNGCHFCGTNTDKGGRSKKGIKDFEYTYCCNAFVHAALAHGGCIPQALKLCRAGSSWGFSASEGYNKSPLFKNLGHPKKSELKACDVLCSDTHVSLYLGGGKIAEASGGDDNKKNSSRWNNSIHITTLSDSGYSHYKRVHRYTGKVNTKSSIYYGEISERVKNLQKFLKWVGYDVKVDGKFGEDTLKAVKKFQKLVGVKADGIVGTNTFNKIKTYKKVA